MILHYKSRFRKNFKKLTRKLQEKASLVLQIFQEHPRDPSLRRHALKGKTKGLESIDVTGDVRIILCQQTGEVVDIIDIGTHSSLYS